MLQRALDVQRRTQGEDAHAACVWLDFQIELLGGQVHRAVHVDQRVAGVEDKQAYVEHAILCREVGGRAIDLHRLVAKQLGQHDVADVEPGRLQQGLADGAIVHQQLEVTIAAAQQRGYRVAGRPQGSGAIDLAKACLHRLEGGEQLLELEMSRVELERALHGGLAAVQAQAAPGCTAGEADDQRIQVEGASLHRQMGRQCVDRQRFLVDDARGAELDIGVHGSPALGAELRHRQQLVGGLYSGLSALLFRGVGIGANQRGQIGEQQYPGVDGSAQFCARMPVVRVGTHELQVAGKLAATHAPAKILVAVVADVAKGCLQMAFGRIRTGIGQGDAGERIQLAHAGAGKPQAHVQRPEVQGVGQSAHERDMAVAQTDIGLYRKWTIGYLQRQHAAGLAVAAGGRALEAACGRPVELVGGGCRGVAHAVLGLLSGCQRFRRGRSQAFPRLLARSAGLPRDDLVVRDGLL